MGGNLLVNKLSIGVLIAVLAATCGQAALAQGAPPAAPPAPNFGTPPSGQIPILYNDHHVYSKPDVLKAGRVLSALVKNGTILIPLRSMFEQMGATVSYDAASQTATVSKPGSEVKVTVGKSEVVVNGESRPLDVPPMLYQGNVLVPVRVISEGMGAYVQWVPEQHVVVVRYVVATPPPSAPPPPPPPSPPTAPPAPTPTPRPAPRNDAYVAGDYIISPKIYNEFSPGNTGTNSWSGRAALEFDAINIPWMIEFDYNQWSYNHNCGVTNPTVATAPGCFVTAIGGRFAYPLGTTKLTNRDGDVRLGIRVISPRVYVGVGYIWGTNSYGYPTYNAVGFGLEKLPDLDNVISVYGSVYYYPNFRGTYTNSAITPPFPTTYGIGYNLLKYRVGVNYVIAGPLFFDAGWVGENGANKNNAPTSFNFNGPYVGFGIKFMP